MKMLRKLYMAEIYFFVFYFEENRKRRILRYTDSVRLLLVVGWIDFKINLGVTAMVLCLFPRR